MEFYIEFLQITSLEPFIYRLTEKWKLTSKKNRKCVYKVSTKITMRKINDTRIFVNEVETQDEENHSGAAKPRIFTIQKTKLDTKP
jgi:hypothetical protein